MTKVSYKDVTEVPGLKVTDEQLSMLVTRYSLARDFSKGKKVLEVACGSGIGIGYLALVAESYTGVDLDKSNIKIADKNSELIQNASVKQMDAHSLEFEDNSFDVVILFEALYYLQNPELFLREVRRVLLPDGKLIISTVNCEWPGFNPSPHSVSYYKVRDLENLLSSEGFVSTQYVAFPDTVDSFKKKMIRTIRRLAVKYNLIPKTMVGKEFLKRLFIGRLRTMPTALGEEHGKKAELKLVAEIKDLSLYKMIYCVAQAR